MHVRIKAIATYHSKKQSHFTISFGNNTYSASVYTKSIKLTIDIEALTIIALPYIYNIYTAKFLPSFNCQRYSCRAALKNSVQRKYERDILAILGVYVRHVVLPGGAREPHTANYLSGDPTTAGAAVGSGARHTAHRQFRKCVMLRGVALINVAAPPVCLCHFGGIVGAAAGRGSRADYCGLLMENKYLLSALLVSFLRGVTGNK